MTEELVRYRSGDEDSARWEGFTFRPGDIVISTRSKTGTTWTQMICALLIFQTPELPAPLAQLSPWLDWLITPREQVFARLQAQAHRRFIKTHTPLDGIPLSPLATYIVVGRHPLDAAVSLYHQGSNINRDRLAELTGRIPDQPRPDRPPRPAEREWLLRWIDADHAPAEYPDSLRGVLWHLSDAWSRRADPGLPGPAILLLHYDELLADLGGQMRALAQALGIEVAEDRWPDLVKAASFASMRAAAHQQAPSQAGVLKDNAAFFRRGTSGAGQELLTSEEMAHYHDRASQFAPAHVLAWLHQFEHSQPGRTHQAMAG
ncbi:MAG TPA: sulfotransferase domain-containing protein [Streptosporangiaceae bacterium]|nr:sulfotransferase domain-containing protein [Streptosporangiaceae bacterium]